MLLRNSSVSTCEADRPLVLRTGQREAFQCCPRCPLRLPRLFAFRSSRLPASTSVLSSGSSRVAVPEAGAVLATAPWLSCPSLGPRSVPRPQGGPAGLAPARSEVRESDDTEGRGPGPGSTSAALPRTLEPAPALPSSGLSPRFQRLPPCPPPCASVQPALRVGLGRPTGRPCSLPTRQRPALRAEAALQSLGPGGCPHRPSVGQV